jgi:hypothetical protein
MDTPIIVCFVGGTAGDIVTQILDPSDLTLERQRLKKPYLFDNNIEKDHFIATSKYKSLPSHDFEYHAKNEHKILGVVCRHHPNAMWAADRFKKLHPPHVWKSMTAFCGADTVDAYAQVILDFGNMLASYTNDVLYLDDIINGYAINQLQELGYRTPGKQAYSKWLTNLQRPTNYI